MSYNQYLQGKAIRTGTEWRLKITINSSALAVFPPSASFKAQFRFEEDGPVAAELHTWTGTIWRVDGNSLEFYLPGTFTKHWHSGQVLMDCVRVDLTQPVHLGFDLVIPVKRSITEV